LASGSDDKTIKLWSLPDGALLKTLSGHTDYVYAVAITPDGRLLVSGSGSKDGTIKLWSLPDGALLKTLEGITYDISAVVISPDGSLLASGSGDGTIKLWSLPDGALLNTLSGHTNRVNALAISPDGRLLASGSKDMTIKLWSLPGGELIGCAFDLAANPPDAKGITYQSTQSGQTVEYTLPCGAPIPLGAVCTCNCVGGSYEPKPNCGCDNYSGPPHYWYPN